MLKVAAPAVKQLRAIAAEVRSFDRAELSVATGLEAALVVGATVVVGHLWKGAGTATAMGTGALTVGLTRVASRDGPSPGTMVAATLAMSISTVMGSLAADHLLLLLALLIVWGFLAGLLVATGPAGEVTGVMAIFGLVASGHFGHALPHAGAAGLLVAIGGGVQTLAACLHRLPAPGKIQVAALYRVLGGCAQRPPSAEQELAVVTALAGVEEVLASPSVPSAQHAVVRDLGRRAREFLDSLMRRPSGGELATARGDALRHESEEAARLTRAGDRAGWRQLVRATIVPEASARIGELTGALSARSIAFRHGLRLAVLLALGWTVAQVLDLPRGYWVPLSAVLVLKPDYEETVMGGASRIVGTCVSAGGIGLLAVYLHPHWIGNAVLVTVVTAIGLVAFRSSSAVGIGAYSGAIVLLLGFAASDTAGTGFARVLDVVTGGLMAIAIYVLWPAPSKLDVGPALARALRCQRDALDDLHRRLSGRDGGSLRGSARAAWASATIAEDAVSQEGATGVQSVDLQRARTVVLSLRRLRLAATRVGRAVRHGPLPPAGALTRFGEWVDESLNTLEDGAARLGGARPPPWKQPRDSASSRPLEDYVCEVADSIDSIATVLSWPRRSANLTNERDSEQQNVCSLH